MSDVKKLNEEQLNEVTGGAGKTKWGYSYDNKGTVTFTDKQGAGSIQISAADWKWPLGQYNGPVGDPEYYLSTVPVKDVSEILDQHHKGLR